MAFADGMGTQPIMGWRWCPPVPSIRVCHRWNPVTVPETILFHILLWLRQSRTVHEPYKVHVVVADDDDNWWEHYPKEWSLQMPAAEAAAIKVRVVTCETVSHIRPPPSLARGKLLMEPSHWFPGLASWMCRYVITHPHPPPATLPSHCCDNADSTNSRNNVQFIFRKVKNWLQHRKLDKVEQSPQQRIHTGA